MPTEYEISNDKKQVLLVGSSHTSLSFLYIKKILTGIANVNKLPDYAGNTEEMLASLPDWPLEGKEIIHVYAGHRDLMLNEVGRPMVSPERFRINLETIFSAIVSRCSAKIVFSNIPLVADNFLNNDLRRNDRIIFYNRIIEEVVDEVGTDLHNFCGFVLNHQSGPEKYSDGLHFTRKFYKEYASDLAGFLMKI